MGYETPKAKHDRYLRNKAANPGQIAQRNHKQRAEKPKHAILYRVRHNAKVRGLECSLTVEDIPDIPKYCPVFPWIELEYRVGQPRHEGSPSLDRINNDIGYVAGNVRIISDRANTAKSDLTFKEIAALLSDAQQTS